MSTPFSLLTALYPDAEMAALVTSEAETRRWLRFEHALARAQAQVGVLSSSDAEAIGGVGVERLDLEALWASARNVGYPILPLVRQIAACLPEGPNGRVHYGATTQDVMDTGLALLLREACELLAVRLSEVGDTMAGLVQAHRDTVMAGRTHGQQAVPTTLGAQLAPVLAALTRNRTRLGTARDDAAVLSLYGAGGTSAALGPEAGRIRELMGTELGLGATPVPWHTARDSVVAVAQVCQLLVGACAGVARNVIDLSRTEIGELHEVAGAHRGASSTMPQKANPILAEGIIGMSATVGGLAAALGRALEVPQERAAGEWQIEWHVIPQVLQLTAATLSAAQELLGGLRVDAEAMQRNLGADGGLVMAEAAMITLAQSLGREHAHDLVYAAALDVRAGKGTLHDSVAAQLASAGHHGQITVPGPQDYLGDAGASCDTAVAAWQAASTADLDTVNVGTVDVGTGQEG